MLRLLVLGFLALLSACPGEGPEPSSSSDTSSSTSLPSTGTSSGSSSTQGESSSTTGTSSEDVCLEVLVPADGSVFLVCGAACGTCDVDELHVEALCVLVTPYLGAPASLCVNTCKGDLWCSPDEICIAIAEGSICVLPSDQL